MTVAIATKKYLTMKIVLYTDNVAAFHQAREFECCCLYTSDAADDEDSVDFVCSRNIKKTNIRVCSILIH